MSSSIAVYHPATRRINTRWGSVCSWNGVARDLRGDLVYQVHRARFLRPDEYMCGTKIAEHTGIINRFPLHRMLFAQNALPPTFQSVPTILLWLRRAEGIWLATQLRCRILVSRTATTGRSHPMWSVAAQPRCRPLLPPMHIHREDVERCNGGRPASDTTRASPVVPGW